MHNTRRGVEAPPKDQVTFPRLLGGRLCLDFVNTIDSPRDTPHDFLTDYAALVRWGHYRALVDDAQVALLLADGARHADDATATYANAIALRAALQQVFTAIASGVKPRPEDLALIHDRYVAGLSGARLVAHEGRFAWESSGDGAQSRLLWPIVQSAVELLMQGELARVKQCSGPDGCGWLFYDESKNGSRRWCSMAGCGAHAKMRRYNARQRLARDYGES
jgi:predicted RNA-binding Zn ribbon-like protein